MEHHCFAFHMDKLFGLWVGRLCNQLSASKKTWKSLERDTWYVSGNRPLCYQSFLIVFCLTVEKLWLEALGTCWQAVSHASLSSQLAVDGKHESVWIRCSMDGGVIRARAKVQIRRKTCILISLCFFPHWLSYICGCFLYVWFINCTLVRLFHFSGLKRWTVRCLTGEVELKIRLEINQLNSL